MEAEQKNKKNCLQQSRSAEDEEEEEKEKERARSYLDQFPWGLRIPRIKEEEDKLSGSAKLLEWQ